MTGWVYNSGSIDTPSIWKFGWDDWSPYPIDAQVTATAIRDRNYDYVTISVVWDPNDTAQALPPLT